MAYHQAPQDDLPEVVTHTRAHHPQTQTHQTHQPHQTPHRKPVPYDTTYGQEQHPPPAPAHGFQRDVTSQPLPNYKPPSLRWTFLCAIIAVILGYMALAEYAVQTLPGVSGRDVVSDFADLERPLDSSPSSVDAAVCFPEHNCWRGTDLF
ncbi:hypothetical protein IMZ48_42915 [Candidatus Bathyarchaeota archaeon]|nr:hypothetical protein [Candidatus Bathyarchaeota archaeon]